MRNYWMLAGVALAAAVFIGNVVAEEKPEPTVFDALDGKAFDIQIREIGSTLPPTADRLVFRGNKLEALGCRAFGFAPTQYAGTTAPDAQTFKCRALSELNGRIMWGGAVQSNRVTGSMRWVKPDGEMLQQTFRGFLVPSLYERLGGPEKIGSIISKFLAVVKSAEALKGNAKVQQGLAGDKRDALQTELTILFCQATGGPQTYDGDLKQRFADAKVSAAEWGAMKDAFKKVLAEEKVGVFDQEDLLKLVDPQP